MGREMAAVALAIVSIKDAEYFNITPGHYFHGMVQNAKRGELNLNRTIWGRSRPYVRISQREAKMSDSVAGQLRNVSRSARRVAVG